MALRSHNPVSKARSFMLFNFQGPILSDFEKCE